nr:EOG090X08ST [Eulimnadia texana]
METETNLPYLKIIEWHMMDKRKFFPLSVTSSFLIRTMLYPFTVIKTRLQIQKGPRAFYKGFWVNAFSVVSGAFYITTYENVRHLLSSYNVNDARVKALVAGGCASLVGQTIIVPFDVISQRLMILGQVEPKTGKPKVLPAANLQIETAGKSKSQIALAVTRDIYRVDGMRGFYRGYVASLCTYVPNSALWWTFYHFYQDHLLSISPPWFSHLLVQCSAAVLGGITTTTLINPLDIIRARVQVQRLDSISQTFRVLWREEGLRIFTKGLSARVIQSTVYSFSIILGYESIKRMSVQDEFKERIRW